MKSIFLIALVFLVTNWPTPSASWSLNQKYADSANTYAQQQQGYDSPLGSSKLMNNGFRLNPELFLSNEDRRAFSRTVGSGNGRSRKLSSTRFNLKPIERVVVDDDEEFIAEQEQQFEAPQQQQFVIPQQQEVQQKEQKTEGLTSMTQLAQESARRLSEQKQEAAKEAIKETVKATVKEATKEAIKQEAKQDVKQDVKEEIKQEVKQDAKEEIKQDIVAATAEIIKEKAAVAEESEKVESIKPLNYKAAPIQRQQQQQQTRPIMSSQWQQKQQQQQQQQQQPDQLRFQIGQADNVNMVDLNFVKNEAIRTMNYRNNLNSGPLSYGVGAKYNQQPAFYPKEIRRPENNYNYNNEREQTRYDDRERYDNDRDRDNSVGDLAKNIGDNVGGLAKEIEKDAKKVIKGFDTIKGTFSSLIIIANSNANANLGVSSIDVDLLKSFLSTYFLGKQVDYVLKDEDLVKLVEKFNAEHLKKSYSSGGDKKYEKYESTSKLSANIPVFSNEHEKAAAPKADEKADVKSSSSILENTVIVKKEDESVNLNYRPRVNVNPIPGGGGYYYLPSPKGSIIVINNLNKNLNERVRAILSGKEINLSEFNAGMILPLKHEHIETLMKDAIIVNNGNDNTNTY